MIQVSSSSWHTRIYLWWYRKKYLYRDSNTTNLCPYMRTVLFWAPARAILWDWMTLFTFSAWGSKIDVPANMFSIPLLLLTLGKLMGYANYTVKTILLIFAGSAAVVSLVITFLVLILARNLYKNRLRAHDREWQEKITKPVKPNKLVVVSIAVYSWSFWALLGEWSKSAHDNVCPPVEIKD